MLTYNVAQGSVCWVRRYAGEVWEINNIKSKIYWAMMQVASKSNFYEYEDGSIFLMKTSNFFLNKMFQN